MKTNKISASTLQDGNKDDRKTATTNCETVSKTIIRNKQIHKTRDKLWKKKPTTLNNKQKKKSLEDQNNSKQ